MPLLHQQTTELVHTHTDTHTRTNKHSPKLSGCASHINQARVRVKLRRMTHTCCIMQTWFCARTVLEQTYTHLRYCMLIPDTHATTLMNCMSQTHKISLNVPSWTTYVLSELWQLLTCAVYCRQYKYAVNAVSGNAPFRCCECVLNKSLNTYFISQ